MLHITKNSLVTDVVVSEVEIRQMEVDWYCNNYSTMTGQAAMLAGFAFSQLTTAFPDEHEPSLPLEFAYLVLVCLTLGLEISAIILSSFLSVWAPSLALKGQKGASDLHRAVDCLRDYQGLVFLYFILGWIAMFVSNILLLWIYFKMRVALVVTLPLSLFIVAIIGLTCSLTGRLRLNENEAVVGKIEQLHTYEFVGDIDNGLHSQHPVATQAREMVQRVDDHLGNENSKLFCSLHDDLDGKFKPKLGNVQS